MKRRGLSVPIFGAVPRLDHPSFNLWLQSFVNNVQGFTRDVVEIGADYDLISHVTRQVLTAGFIITPDSHDIEIYAASAVTSDTSIAIRNGRNGQTIVLTNTDSFSITIKDAANTRLGEDVVLGLYDTLVLKWSDTLEEWTIIGTGHLAPTTSRGSIAAGSDNVGAGEDTIWTWTMPVNTLVTNSMLSVSAIGRAANNANAKTLKFHVGGSSIVLNPTTVIPVNVRIVIDIKLWYSTSTSVRGTVVVMIPGVGLEQSTDFTFSTTIDLTTTVVVKFTGEATTDGDVGIVRASALVDRII